MILEEMQHLLINQGYKLTDLQLTEIIDNYYKYEKQELMKLTKKEAVLNLISQINYLQRKSYKSSELVGMRVNVGDVCYIDFGTSYITEAGYQHFGLVIASYNSKALVVPMTSNVSMYQQSYCELEYPLGKRHLFRLGEVKGLAKKSVLFLNDIKFINTARVIEKRGFISPSEVTFQRIMKRIMEDIFKY